MVKNANSFRFENYRWEDKKTLVFTYCVVFNDAREEQFTEKLELPFAVDKQIVDEKILHEALWGLNMMLGISYYKLYLPQQIEIDGYSLTKSQADFWKDVYTKGLGEFFYKNQIDFRGLVNFPFDESVTKTNWQPSRLTESLHGDLKLTDRVLIPIGGGKDSIVSAELVKKSSLEAVTLYSDDFQKIVADTIGVPAMRIIRSLDHKLFDPEYKKNTYDGHVPMTAIWSFVSLLIAILYDYRFIVFSNERSASYGNVEYLGTEINHQWSKSKEFEDLFRDYVKKNVTSSTECFSLLRPFYEIEIIRRFAEYPQYFPVFSSCNKNYKRKFAENSAFWCGECDKCAFVFCMLAANVSKDELIAIFGKNLLASENLIESYRQLLGIKDIKPFECVGTPEEVKMAFYKVYQRGEFNNDVVMKMFAQEVLPTMNDIKNLETEVFSYGDDSNIPEEFRQLIKNPSV